MLVHNIVVDLLILENAPVDWPDRQDCMKEAPPIPISSQNYKPNHTESVSANQKAQFLMNCEK